MHIAIVTAGGAGMFCGSCMHDNAWARALIAAGHEVSLIPTYTPIRVDEPSVAGSRVFFGGLNVYLDARSRLWRAVPRSLKKWLDRPGVLNLVSRLAVRNDASQLGDLTLAMLEGEHGPNRDAVEELATFIADDLKPDFVIFSNALLSGAVTRLKERFRGPVCVVLQGDDVFLDGLPAGAREAAVTSISERSREFDAILTHSRFYRDYMADYLRLDVSRAHLLPLSLDPDEHSRRPNGSESRPPTIGFFARIAPEKGLHALVDAVEILRRRHPEVRLRVGGYLGRQNQEYWDSILSRTGHWGAGFESIGSPSTLAEKVRFFHSCDVVSVPTEFREPKGIYVLESLANGVPVVQPAHGAFPELIESTGGGWLVPPRDPAALADRLEEVLRDHAHREGVAEQGHAGVRDRHSPRALADATVRILDRLGRLN